jgi:hypothetical protein
VRFDLIVACQVEPLFHALNVFVRKKRPNVCLKARRFRRFSHCSSPLLDFASAALAPHNSIRSRFRICEAKCGATSLRLAEVHRDVHRFGVDADNISKVAG